MLNTLWQQTFQKMEQFHGPNFDMYKRIKENSNINFIVSGGIKNRKDVEKLSELGYYGCIIGKALYEGKINLKELNLN